MSFIKNVLSTFFSNSVGMVMGFVNSVLTIRILGLLGKGEITILNTSFSLLVMVMGLGMHTAIIFYISQKKLNINKVINSFIVLSIFVGLVSFYIIYYYSSKNLEIFLPKIYHNTSYILWFSVFIISSIFLSVLKSILNGLKKIDFQNIVNVISIIVLFISFIIFYFINKFGIVNINSFDIFMLIQVVSTLQILVLVYYLYNVIGLTYSFNFLSLSQLKMLVTWGGIAFLATTVQFLNYRLDFWFVEYYLGIPKLGIYSLSSNLSQMVWMVSKSFSLVLFPYIAAKSLTQKKIVFINKTIFLLMAFFVLIALPFITYFIKLLYGVDFILSSLILKILLIGTVPFIMSNILGSYFSGNNLLKINLLASFVGLIITVIFDLLLIPRYGLVGSSIATVLSYLSTTICIVLFFVYYEKISIKNVFLYSKEDYLTIKKIINEKFRNKKIL